MKTLLLIFSLLLITTNAYAENTKLHCNGKEEFTDFIKQEKTFIIRDFKIDFNEKTNYLSWGEYDFSMCGIEPSNDYKHIKSETRFSNEFITYECEEHSIPSAIEGKNTGQLILDRYTGVIKTYKQHYRKISKEKKDITFASVGNFSCDHIVKKKF